MLGLLSAAGRYTLECVLPTLLGSIWAVMGVAFVSGFDVDERIVYPSMPGCGVASAIPRPYRRSVPLFFRIAVALLRPSSSSG